MATLPSKSVPLYGGALAASLPITFADVSNIRQVPDHQEVWLDSEGFTSVIIDILQRVSLSVSDPDAEALRYHLKDIVDSDGSSDASRISIISASEITFPKFPHGTKGYGLLAEVPRAEKMIGRSNEPEFVAMYLMVVRLEAQGTDLVVGINVPHVVGSQGYEGCGEVDLRSGRMGSLMEMAEKIRGVIVETLEVKDWDLFVQE